MNAPNTFKEIIAADEARYQALYAQDVNSLARMLREDYLHTHATGRRDDKEMFLLSIAAAKYRFVHSERSEQMVRSVGNVSLLTGKTKTTIEVGGEVKTLNNAFVTVWVREASEWKLLQWQATKLPDARAGRDEAQRFSCTGRTVLADALGTFSHSPKSTKR